MYAVPRPFFPSLSKSLKAGVLCISTRISAPVPSGLLSSTKRTLILPPIESSTGAILRLNSRTFSFSL